ncbi:lipopolysaccharide assembly protein LapB [Halomonas urumqiensis]|uniref:Lipopolysaccharide assembly protein B n=1 Tax=Halomonas urumqiensis TaxID=1684789 RepID=A0A2N7UQL2_9GAMM|nr:lipopolysaccharide assembly protein LapB [Halomonas urumqiensis]PMR82702.1 lipopolysaccharide assembly protein LapB [Halomonas urumqiensis]PTB01979.1 lipopolysaccharide assembly protein LapB [Halomonas urumqiensis]GHE22092.1 lipopolysaccharide assembly protein B [Halomonas urumqiensis]
MPDALLLTLLLAAVAIGWWLGRRDRRTPDDPGAQTELARDYFVGLNYLLNDQQDMAIETFVAALEVNSETIETHITLGNLFRTRGEADRAVKIHQNLLARPTLTPPQSERVQLELSRDFLKLGLLDRAERLLQGLVRDTHDDEIRRSAKQLLVDLLEREGEWQAAFNVAHPHLIRQHDETRRAAAHWLCQLAEQERGNASPGLARKHLRQALNIDAKCVRANLLLAGLEHDTGHYRQEIRLLARVPDQDTAFTATILEPLANAYRLLDDEDGLIKHLQSLLERTPHTSLIILFAETLRQREGASAAIALVSDQLDRESSLGALDYLIGLYRQDARGEPQERLALLQRHTQTLWHALPRHRCRRCGFAGEHLHWQCPRCRSWGTTKPITGIEGE